jgi:hypothetical protein
MKNRYHIKLLEMCPQNDRAFLSALHTLEYTAVAEVRFNISEPYTCSLMDCLIVFVVLVLHMNFKGPESEVV